MGSNDPKRYRIFPFFGQVTFTILGNAAAVEMDGRDQQKERRFLPSFLPSCSLVPVCLCSLFERRSEVGRKSVSCFFSFLSLKRKVQVVAVPFFLLPPPIPLLSHIPTSSIFPPVSSSNICLQFLTTSFLKSSESREGENLQHSTNNWSWYVTSITRRLRERSGEVEVSLLAFRGLHRVVCH